MSQKCRRKWAPALPERTPKRPEYLIAFFATYWTGSVGKVPFNFWWINTCAIFLGWWGEVVNIIGFELNMKIDNPPIFFYDVLRGTCIVNISKPCWILRTLWILNPLKPSQIEIWQILGGSTDGLDSNKQHTHTHTDALFWARRNVCDIKLVAWFYGICTLYCWFNEHWKSTRNWSKWNQTVFGDIAFRSTDTR